MKKHDLFKILGIVILVYVVLTWIFDASHYSGFLQVVGKEEVGLGYLINVPIQTLGYFSYLFVFILAKFPLGISAPAFFSNKTSTFDVIPFSTEILPATSPVLL